MSAILNVFSEASENSAAWVFYFFKILRFKRCSICSRCSKCSLHSKGSNYPSIGLFFLAFNWNSISISKKCHNFYKFVGLKHLQK
jgi:hypothetical protein